MTALAFHLPSLHAVLSASVVALMWLPIWAAGRTCAPVRVRDRGGRA